MRLSLLLLALATGCNAVSGDVDGDPVDIDDAFYIEDDNAFGDDGLIQVFLLGIPDACAVTAEFLDDFDDADSPSERADAWKDNFPEEFWEFQVWIRVDDVDDELAGQELDGIDWDDALESDDEVGILARRYHDHPDDESFSWWGAFTGDATDYYETYRSDDGDAKISGHSPGESIRGSFGTTMVDADGDDEGEITLRFSAQRCRDVEDELFD
ncbi:MAG: hypothetical protein H6739_02445 [Alphaproteobacteria bacterium]|nr:hypothetical protein [Alphaproteobacteria bacterium]